MLGVLPAHGCDGGGGSVEVCPPASRPRPEGAGDEGGAGSKLFNGAFNPVFERFVLFCD